MSKPHHYLGEACGFLTWMWIFYRAKQDLPVVLGWRHPWEHADDPWKIVDHVDDLEGLEKSWDEVSRQCEVAFYAGKKWADRFHLLDLLVCRKVLEAWGGRR